MTLATQSYESELVEITELVWNSMLDLPLVLRVPGDPAPARNGSRTFTGCVQVTGAWEGAITVHCSEELARTITAAMFGSEPEETTNEEVSDALGELANMIGGNVKALMPEPCKLSLPTVADGVDYRLKIPGTQPLTAVVWTCGDEPLMVRILVRA